MSFANFVPLVIAARVLPIDEFGHYSIIWAISLLVVSAATALIVDPLPAIVSTRSSTMLKPILGAAAQLTFLLACCLAGLILICGLGAWAWSPSSGLLLVCLALVVPMQQLQFACRRFCYILRRQWVAAVSAVAYAAVLIGGVLLLWATSLCTAPRLILLWGGASLAAAAVGFAGSRVPLWKVAPRLRRWLLTRCWQSGKWLAGSNIALWLSGASVLPYTALILGPSETGILRAQLTLFMPVYQFAWAMGFLMVPVMADAGAKQPASQMRTQAVLMIAILGAAALAFSATILIFGIALLDLVYGRSEITAQSGLLWPLAISVTVDVLTTSMAIVLTAKAATRFIFWARVASVVVFVVSAACLVPTIALDGIVWALVIANCICALIHIPALVRTLGRRDRMLSL
ncbi:Membrane protein involved in the export of O-antigen and teichoic acid [Rhodospirillales bacterium URHD0017]|nr:Membrane protein involved in the export of O-antigen and teichoic acid [Rhodospirillales bacterium URHD0017]